MFEPDPSFIRRIEASVSLLSSRVRLLTSLKRVHEQLYKSTHPSMPVRVYFCVYTNSVEEQKYLSAIRREKNAFEKLIKERAVRSRFFF